MTDDVSRKQRSRRNLDLVTFFFSFLPFHIVLLLRRLEIMYQWLIQDFPSGEGVYIIASTYEFTVFLNHDPCFWQYNLPQTEPVILSAC